MTCWGKWKMLRDILFPRCFVDVFPWLKHWLSITWGMNCSFMFIRFKTSSTEEGMIVFTRAPLCHLHCTSLRRVTAQTRELELIAATLVNACVYTRTFLNRPRSGFPRSLCSDLSCHIKDCQNGIYCLNFLEFFLCLFSTRVPIRKTRTENFRYEYVYHYTPSKNICCRDLLIMPIFTVYKQPKERKPSDLKQSNNREKNVFFWQITTVLKYIIH